MLAPPRAAVPSAAPHACTAPHQRSRSGRRPASAAQSHSRQPGGPPGAAPAPAWLPLRRALRVRPRPLALCRSCPPPAVADCRAGPRPRLRPGTAGQDQHRRVPPGGQRVWRAQHPHRDGAPGGGAGRGRGEPQRRGGRLIKTDPGPGSLSPASQPPASECPPSRCSAGRCRGRGGCWRPNAPRADTPACNPTTTTIPPTPGHHPPTPHPDPSRCSRTARRWTPSSVLCPRAPWCRPSRSTCERPAWPGEKPPRGGFLPLSCLGPARSHGRSRLRAAPWRPGAGAARARRRAAP
jgi:hypothetical protein